MPNTSAAPRHPPSGDGLWQADQMAAACYYALIRRGHRRHAIYLIFFFFPVLKKGGGPPIVVAEMAGDPIEGGALPQDMPRARVGFGEMVSDRRQSWRPRIRVRECKFFQSDGVTLPRS